MAQPSYVPPPDGWHAYPEPPLLLRVPEVARLLGLSDRHVYELCLDGRLHSLVLGKRCRRIPREAVDTFLAQYQQPQAVK